MIAAIVNPSAGSGAARRRWPYAARLLEARLGAFETRFTERPDHAATLARELAEQGCDLIIVAGGDGTLNEVVNGLLPGTACPRLGLLPLASGGDFARTLQLSDLAQAVDTLATGEARPIDAFRARFTRPDGRPAERYFLNAASIGLGAVAAMGVRGWARVIPGSGRYLAAAVPALASGRAYTITLRRDDGPPETFRVTTAAVANGRYQGGGICIAPDARLDDGLAGITIVERVSLLEVAAHISILYNGALYTYPKVRHWRASRVRVESESVVPIELDGEPVGTLPLTVDVLPHSLRFLQRK